MERKSIRRRIIEYVIIAVASVFYGMGVSLFLDPNKLAPGGFTGIAIIINHYVSIPVGTLFMILNIPIMILAVWKFGWKFMLSTGYAIVMVSISCNFFAQFGVVTTDPLLAAIAGAVLLASGIGLIFKMGATTGGSDIIVKCLRIRYKHIKTGSLFLMSDALVVAASAIAFRDLNTALYAGIALFVSSIVMDMVLYGTDEAKLIYIISETPDNIAPRLMDELDAGATFIKGRGAYSKVNKHVIMCVVKKQMAPKLEEIVKEEDPDAFMIVTKATEIYGEGYKNIFAEKI
ncbi:MAG: YitT family protein [Lachnospiraceae bacterium]|nr:YitT family protein [Lachnospiraceae bacterium]